MASPVERLDPVGELAQLLETFTPEAEDAALKRCTELGFDPDGGFVPLAESFINLRSARVLLLDAIRSSKLIQLPLSIQFVLLTKAQAISKGFEGLAAGRDEVTNLSRSIEELHVAMWQYRLDNLSPELLGYQRKQNDLKRLEREIGSLRDELKGGVVAKRRLETIVESAEQILKKLNASTEAAESSESSISETLKKIEELEDEIGALHKNAQQTDAAIVNFSSNAKAAAAEAAAYEKKIVSFFEQISEFRTEMEDASKLQEETAKKWQTDAQDRAAEDAGEKKLLLEQLETIKHEINKHLQNAVGASLFSSFGKRKEALATNTDKWFHRMEFALGLSFLIGAGIALDIGLFGIGYLPAFFLKISLTLPFIFAVWFCTEQYSRERKLEEEYAFKSNISVSLVAYRDLVEQLIAHDNEIERQRYMEFMIGSIQEIFRPPSGTGSSPAPQGEKHDETLVNAAGELVKAIPEVVKSLPDVLLKALRK